MNEKSQFLTNAEITVKALDKYYSESKNESKPVINQQAFNHIIEELDLSSYLKDKRLSEKNLNTFIEKYLSFSTRLHQPSYMAHQVSAPHQTGALGSFIDGFTNNAMAIYEMGPAASSIEYFMINWLLELIGWIPAPLSSDQIMEKENYGGGVLTHGGSLANLTAMIAARSNLDPGIWQNGNPNNLAILAPAGTHYSIERAAGIIGIGLNSVYHMDVDKRGAIIPEKLDTMYESIIYDGKIPMALVANGCSTSVGIYDPIDEIGDFCNEKNLWLHIDGAHGASILLSEKYKHYLKGIEKADSVIWDTHKMMRVPTLCAALLVKDHKTIDNAFQQEASYLFHEKDQPGFDFLQRTVECTKAGLGLKFFMTVAGMGTKKLSDYLENQNELAEAAYSYINKQSGFKCAVKPESNILCFRVEGNDELQIRIRNRLIADGEFYISSTMFNKERYLRLAIMNPDTNLNHIKRLVNKIKEYSNSVFPE